MSPSLVPSVSSKYRFARLQLRRAAQTPRTFSNWPELLAGVARARLGRGPHTLTFRTRSGQVMTIPNADGARVPIYEVFAEDSYDLEWHLGDLLRRPIRVLDIGAHVGSFSCRLGQLHPGAVVDAYEPAPDTFQFLRANIEANGLADRVTAHEAALAGETGRSMLDQAGRGSGMNRLATAGQDGEGTAAVRTVSFDDAVGLHGPVDFVKMDCEGGEYDLVYASTRESWQSVHRLVLEYHAVVGHSWPELRTWFADIGLHVLRDCPAEPGLGVAWLSRQPVNAV